MLVHDQVRMAVLGQLLAAVADLVAELLSRNARMQLVQT